MELLLRRKPATDEAILGELFLDGLFYCFTLERAGVEVSPGRYQVALTVSGRAEAGHLWSPRDDDRLPELLKVPGRTGIRIHAANEPQQLTGCIAVGNTVGVRWIGKSRDALRALMARMAANGAMFLTIQPASASETANV